MSRKWIAGLMAGLLAMAVLAGCGKSGTSQQGGFKAAMATDVGGINDQSFNASAWRGLQMLKDDIGAEVNYVESKRQEDYETNLATLADQGYNIVWGVGFLMTNAIGTVADQYPDTYFGLIDGEVQGKPNVVSVLFNEQEGSFLMGIFAAKTTKTGKVGFVGGMEIPVIERFEAGFKAGVKAVDPNVQVITVYTGEFNDPEKGKAAALNIYGQGADVIFHASGKTGEGVIEAAKELNKYAIGVDSDQNHLAPEHVISSMMKRVDVAVYTLSKRAAEGNFPGGQTVVLGLKDNGVGWSDTTLWDKMPPDTKDVATKWAEAIKAGKVTVPSTRQELESWQVPEI
ncbi:MAG: BMP family ABC transporter substrate-binding protein [Bacillota bacterium]